MTDEAAFCKDIATKTRQVIQSIFKGNMQVKTFNHRNEPAESKLLHFKPIQRWIFNLFFFLRVYTDKDREDHSRQVEPGMTSG